jgi:hypothetical protein
MHSNLHRSHTLPKFRLSPSLFSLKGREADGLQVEMFDPTTIISSLDRNIYKSALLSRTAGIY